MFSHYHLLGISSNASQDEIEKAYKKAVLKWHPDRGRAWAHGAEELFHELFIQVKDAYDVLKNKRAAYDASLVNPSLKAIADSEALKGKINLLMPLYTAHITKKKLSMQLYIASVIGDLSKPKQTQGLETWHESYENLRKSYETLGESYETLQATYQDETSRLNNIIDWLEQRYLNDQRTIELLKRELSPASKFPLRINADDINYFKETIQVLTNLLKLLSSDVDNNSIYEFAKLALEIHKKMLSSIVHINDNNVPEVFEQLDLLTKHLKLLISYIPKISISKWGDRRSIEQISERLGFLNDVLVDILERLETVPEFASNIQGLFVNISNYCLPKHALRLHLSPYLDANPYILGEIIFGRLFDLQARREYPELPQRSNRDWNAEFQKLLDNNNSERIQALSEDFVKQAEMFCQFLVPRLYLPEAKENLQPYSAQHFGGWLGGDKFIYDNIFVKVSRAFNNILGSDEGDQKIASHELRAMNAWIRFDLNYQVRVPLSVVLYIEGHVLIASALLPISKNTLIHGNNDVCIPFKSSNDIKLLELIGKFAEENNLAKHAVDSIDEEVELAFDVEFHKVQEDDGRIRIYMVNQSRIFPPTPLPILQQYEYDGVFSYLSKFGLSKTIPYHLYQLFRPEFLKKLHNDDPKLLLISDAYYNDHTSYGNTNIAKAFQEHMLPRFKMIAEALDNKSVVTPLNTYFHKLGVNMRYLGKIFLLCKNDDAKKRLMHEMILRRLKHILRAYRSMTLFSSWDEGMSDIVNTSFDSFPRHLEDVSDDLGLNYDILYAALLKSIEEKYELNKTFNEPELSLNQLKDYMRDIQIIGFAEWALHKVKPMQLPKLAGINGTLFCSDGNKSKESEMKRTSLSPRVGIPS